MRMGLVENYVSLSSLATESGEKHGTVSTRGVGVRVKWGRYEGGVRLRTREADKCLAMVAEQYKPFLSTVWGWPWAHLPLSTSQPPAMLLRGLTFYVRTFIRSKICLCSDTLPLPPS